MAVLRSGLVVLCLFRFCELLHQRSASRFAFLPPHCFRIPSPEPPADVSRLKRQVRKKVQVSAAWRFPDHRVRKCGQSSAPGCCAVSARDRRGLRPGGRAEWLQGWPSGWSPGWRPRRWRPCSWSTTAWPARPRRCRDPMSHGVHSRRPVLEPPTSSGVCRYPTST